MVGLLHAVTWTTINSVVRSQKRSVPFLYLNTCKSQTHPYLMYRSNSVKLYSSLSLTAFLITTNSPGIFHLSSRSCLPWQFCEFFNLCFLFLALSSDIHNYMLQPTRQQQLCWDWDSRFLYQNDQACEAVCLSYFLGNIYYVLIISREVLNP